MEQTSLSSPVALGALIADDKEASRKSNAITLRQFGFDNIFMASNPVEAASVFIKNFTKICLVMTDLVFDPLATFDKQGMNIARSIKKIVPLMPVVLYSSFADRQPQENERIDVDMYIDMFIDKSTSAYDYGQRWSSVRKLAERYALEVANNSSIPIWAIENGVSVIQKKPAIVSNNLVKQLLSNHSLSYSVVTPQERLSVFGDSELNVVRISLAGRNGDIWVVCTSGEGWAIAELLEHPSTFAHGDVVSEAVRRLSLMIKRLMEVNKEHLGTDLLNAREYVDSVMDVDMGMEKTNG